jgi:hypothetical protein
MNSIFREWPDLSPTDLQLVALRVMGGCEDRSVPITRLHDRRLDELRLSHYARSCRDTGIRHAQLLVSIACELKELIQAPLLVKKHGNDK